MRSLPILLAVVVSVPAAGQERVDFQHQVLPILIQHCTNCHGPKKAAGELRLHSPEMIREFDVEYLLAPGRPEESALIDRLTLAEDDDLRMPKDADPLPRAEIDLLRQWIAQGADMSLAEPPAEAAGEFKIPSADPEVINKLKQSGAHASQVFVGSPLLQVSYRYSELPPTDKQLELLTTVAEQIVSLDLGGRPLESSSLAFLSDLKNLKKLNLENTGIGDDALVSLAHLTQLQQLNLHSTPITDDGLRSLSQLKKLRHLHLWNTNISYDAAMELKKALPEAEIDLGWSQPEIRAARLKAELNRVRQARADAERREVEARGQRQLAEAREAELAKEISKLTAETGDTRRKSN